MISIKISISEFPLPEFSDAKTDVKCAFSGKIRKNLPQFQGFPDGALAWPNILKVKRIRIIIFFRWR